MAVALANEQIRQVVGFLKRANRILFITGAGLSADSGMPTYRGVGGLYADLPIRDGLTIEDLLSGHMMRTQPEVVWEYLSHLGDAFQQAAPNRGHEVIAAMEVYFPEVWVLTQNVDGLHTRAGSQKVIEIHGDIHGLICMSCEYTAKWIDLTKLPIPPNCPECGAILRPDVVLFGEMLNEANIEMLQNQLLKGFDLVFSVGTSSLFPYITQPVIAMKQLGANTVEINPGETNVSAMVDVKIAVNAAPTLAAIWQMFRAG